MNKYVKEERIIDLASKLFVVEQTKLSQGELIADDLRLPEMVRRAIDVATKFLEEAPDLIKTEYRVKNF